MSARTTNQKLRDWVAQWAEILTPEEIYWCDGSAEEYDRLCAQLVAAGTFERLNVCTACIKSGKVVKAG